MTWHPNGILRQMGVLDFAGGTVVHISAGIAALIGAMFLGRRQSHISKEAQRPANIPYVILGAGMLWFGWFDFNAGSALGAVVGLVAITPGAGFVTIPHSLFITFYHTLFCPGCCIFFCAIVSYLLYRVADFIAPMRETTEEERLGLDHFQHAESIIA